MSPGNFKACVQTHWMQGPIYRRVTSSLTFPGTSAFHSSKGSQLACANKEVPPAVMSRTETCVWIALVEPSTEFSFLFEAFGMETSLAGWSSWTTQPLSIKGAPTHHKNSSSPLEFCFITELAE